MRKYQKGPVGPHQCSFHGVVPLSGERKVGLFKERMGAWLLVINCDFNPVASVKITLEMPFSIYSCCLHKTQLYPLLYLPSML